MTAVAPAPTARLVGPLAAASFPDPVFIFHVTGDWVEDAARWSGTTLAAPKFEDARQQIQSLVSDQGSAENKLIAYGAVMSALSSIQFAHKQGTPMNTAAKNLQGLIRPW